MSTSSSPGWASGFGVVELALVKGREEIFGAQVQGGTGDSVEGRGGFLSGEFADLD